MSTNRRPISLGKGEPTRKAEKEKELTDQENQKDLRFEKKLGSRSICLPYTTSVIFLPVIFPSFIT